MGIAYDLAGQIALSHQMLRISPWHIMSRVLQKIYGQIAERCILSCSDEVKKEQ